ncbi:MAG: ABC transporter ATP-binding protein [Actinomycetota bacterium]
MPTRAASETAVASCVNVSKSYVMAAGNVTALDDVTYTFHRGKLTVVGGPSGSGKSTLLRMLVGLDVPTTGEVWLDDEPISRLRNSQKRRIRRSRVAYVFQKPSDNLISYLTVWEHMTLAARSRKVDTREIGPLLEDLGIAHRLRNLPKELSGGEQQRLAFAQAVLGTPSLVAADEPTAELDSATADHLIDVMKKIAARDIAVVVASHDPDVIARADAILRLEQGRTIY